MHRNLRGGNLTLHSLRLAAVHKLLGAINSNCPIQNWQRPPRWHMTPHPTYTHTHEHTYKSLLVEPCSAYKGLHCKEDGDESCMLEGNSHLIPSLS